MHEMTEKESKIYALQVELLGLLKKPSWGICSWIKQEKKRILDIRKEIYELDRNARLYLNWGGPSNALMVKTQPLPVDILNPKRYQ